MTSSCSTSNPEAAWDLSALRHQSREMLLDSSYSAKFRAPRRADNLHNYSAVTFLRRFSHRADRIGGGLGGTHASDRDPDRFGFDAGVWGGGGGPARRRPKTPAPPRREGCGVRRGLVKAGVQSGRSAVQD